MSKYGCILLISIAFTIVNANEVKECTDKCDADYGVACIQQTKMVESYFDCTKKASLCKLKCGLQNRERHLQRKLKKINHRLHELRKYWSRATKYRVLLVKRRRVITISLLHQFITWRIMIVRNWSFIITFWSTNRYIFFVSASLRCEQHKANVYLNT